MKPDNDSTAFLLKVLNDAFRRIGDKSMKEDGITHSQMGVLLYLEGQEGGTGTYKNIERFLHVSQPSTVGLISRLEQKGLLSTSSSPTDQRAKIAALTEKGYEVLVSGSVHFEATVTQMEAGISQEELDALKLTLKKMIANLGATTDPEKEGFSVCEGPE